MKYYSARKKNNDILSFATQWIPLESIMLTEIHQSPSKKIACFSWSAIIHTKYKNVIIRCESDIRILDHCAPPLFINLKNSFFVLFFIFCPLPLLFSRYQVLYLYIRERKEEDRWKMQADEWVSGSTITGGVIQVKCVHFI